MKRSEIRDVVRLVVVDARRTLLLLRYSEGLDGKPASYWVTPGGAIEPGETLRDAAIRELAEETGLHAAIGDELWTREFELPASHARRRQRERFFLVRLGDRAPRTQNSSSESIREQRWWTSEELATSAVVIYPLDLATRVTAFLKP